MARSSRSMAMTRLRAFRQQRARQPARPGADFDHGYAVERAAGARDARGEIEIEQEILAEGFLRR